MLKHTFLIFAALSITSAAYADAIGGGPTSGSFSAGVFSVTPTVTASAYTTNNAIGGLQKVPMARTTVRPSLILNGIGVFSKGGITAPLVVYAFTAATNTGNTLNSTCADKSAFVLSNTDAPYLIPGFPITLTPVATAGTTQTTAGINVNTTVQNADTPATTNIYFCWVTTGTPTPASTTDLIFTCTGLQD